MSRIIDQFHKVIRAGHFVIEGYEKFVGTRTDCNITRNKKYDQLSPHSRETINEFMIVSAVSERSLGLCAIDYCIETYPAHPLDSVDKCVKHVLEQLADSTAAVCFRTTPEDRKKYADMGVTVFLEPPPDAHSL